MEPNQTPTNDNIPTGSPPDTSPVPATPQVIGPSFNNYIPDPGTNVLQSAPDGQPQPSYSYNTQPKSKKKFPFVVAGLVIFLLFGGAGGGLIVLNKRSQDKSKAQQLSSEENKDSKKSTSLVPPVAPIAETPIVYEKLKKVQATDGGFSISVPEQLESKQHTSEIILYNHPKPNKTSLDVYTSLAVAKETIPETEMPQVKSILISQLKAKSGLVYDQVRQSILQQGVIDVQFGTFTDFKGGIMANMSVKDSGGNLGEARIILMFTKSSMYTIVIGADKVVWDSNADIFNQVVNSIQVK